MKKNFKFVFALLFAALCFAACGDDDKDKDKQLPKEEENVPEKEDEEKEDEGKTKLTSIRFSDDNMTVSVGATIKVCLNSSGESLTTPRLVLVTDPADLELENVKLTSDDNEVAVVNSDGTISCKGPGMALIKASVDGLSAKCKLSVIIDEGDKGFLMYAGDVFSVIASSSRPQITALAGRVKYGSVKVGGKAGIHMNDGSIKTASIYQLATSSKKSITEANAGDSITIAFLATDLQKTEVERGCAVTMASTNYKSSTKFTADIYFKTSSEGGLATLVPAYYRPQLYFGNADRTCMLSNSETLTPGNVYKNVELQTITSMLVVEGDTFELREGGKRVGTGIIKQIR